jgi:hexosaminidase
LNKAIESVHLISSLTPHILVPILALTVFGCQEGGLQDLGPEHRIIPNPSTVEFTPADTFHLGKETRIFFDAGDAEAERIGGFLADLIGNTVETTPDVLEAEGQFPVDGIHLTRQGASPSVGPEGYELLASSTGVTIRASGGAGLFYGVQTLRQMLPAIVEYQAAYPQPLFVPGVQILDNPRFGWRGFMLDVSRHFFGIHDVKRFMDLMALYKMNRLHLHLSDDQGWRIEIPGLPNLTDYAGGSQVGGKGGGYYSVEEYAELVRYAQDRFITIVPEIDVPGHTNAALASYPELNCDGVAPELFTGTAVGFSSLCTTEEATYDFLERVVREIATLTPGPFFHVGGDEVKRLTSEEYNAFIERMEGIVRSHGKRMVGWDEVAMAELGPGSLVQLWRPLWPAEGAPEPDSAAAEAAAELEAGVMRVIASGGSVILSPADRLYLDMKYDPSTPIGLTWAGMADVRTSYDWAVKDLFGKLPEEAIAGVEAPLWSETLGSISDIEYMAFPRIPGVAELGWSQESRRSWEDYRLRLGAQAPRWTVLGINFHRSPHVPWQEGWQENP